MAQATGGFPAVRSLLLVDPAMADAEGALRSVPADALIIDIATQAVRRAERNPRGASAAAFVTRMRARAYRPLLLIRIASLTDGSTDDDLDVVMPAKPDGIILAGGPDGAAVQRLGVKLGVREAIAGVPEGSTAIVAECGSSGLGLLSLRSLIGASPRLAAMSWSAGDLASDCGGAPEAFAEDETAGGVARTLLLLGASAARVIAFDTAVAASGDALARDCRAARRLGYGGKITALPAQVPVINAVFARDSAGGRGATTAAVPPSRAL